MNFQQKWEIIDSIKPHPQFAIIGAVGGLAIGGTAAVGTGMALGGLAAGALGDGLMGSGGDSSGGVAGGGGNSAGATSGGGGNGISASLLGTLAGGAALNSLFGNGVGSINASTAAGQAAADPFGPQRGQYTGGLAAGIGNQQAIANYTSSGGNQWGANTMIGLAGQNMTSQGLNAATGHNVQDPNIARLTNQNTAQQFEYQTGLDALMRGQAQSGTMASGAQMLQLQDYGQQSASRFLQQDFSNAVASQTSSNATNQLNYNQQLGTAQNNQTAQLEQFGENQNIFSAGQATNAQAFGQQNTTNSLLALLSGATTGSPAEAGQIAAGKYGNQQTTIASLLKSMSGGGSSGLGGGVGTLINGLQSGIKNLGSLFGSGTGEAAGTQTPDSTGSDILAAGNNYSDANYGGGYSYDTGSGIVDMNQDAGDFLSSGF